jgi:uncharacterized protein YlxW (UPF0749 family)
MKKLIAIVSMLVFLVPVAFTEAKKQTEIEKYQAQFQALAQQRQQYLQAITSVETEMIKLQAVIEYLQAKDKEKK